MQDKQIKKEILKKERFKFLHVFEKRLDVPMVFFAFLWLIVLFIKLVSDSKNYNTAFFLLWGILLVDFLLRFWISPNKLFFIKTNKLIVFSVVFPPLRILRIFLLFIERKKSLHKEKLPSKKDSPAK